VSPAAAVSRVLSLIAVDNPRLAARWRDPRPKFSDISPAHLSYPAAARSVSAGVMAKPAGGTLQRHTRATGGLGHLAGASQLARGGAIGVGGRHGNARGRYLPAHTRRDGGRGARRG